MEAPYYFYPPYLLWLNLETTKKSIESFTASPKLAKTAQRQTEQDER